MSAQNTLFLFGEGLFETIPVYSGKPLFLEEHLARLEKGCRFLRWGLWPKVEFEKAIALFNRKLVKANYLIRFTLVKELEEWSNNGRGRDLPALFATTRPLRHDSRDYRPLNENIGICPWPVPQLKMVPNEFKIPFYLPTQIVLRDKPQWREVLWLNKKKEVVDGGFSTPIWFDGKNVQVSPLRLGGLRSVTRQKILQLCVKMGINVIEKPWTPKNVFKKGELLFVGSGVGIMSASHLQGRKMRSFGLAVRLWQHYRQWALHRNVF